MKSTVHPDGRVDLDGTPEELAAFERERTRVPLEFSPPRYGNATLFCTCAAQVWGTYPQRIGKNPCALHDYTPAFPQITAAAPGPSFAAAEIGRVGASCRCGSIGFTALPHQFDDLYGTRHTPDVCTATGMQAVGSGG